ncbi:hypothetical protein HN587_00425 [Candidatus Woesearchaeota archaeon]|jgi:hypothetical protein|nr:hypothetical protein [Candidatus Woesearchaeota archaeon]
MGHIIKEAEGRISVIQYDGVFDYDGLITFLHGWFTKRKWFFHEKVVKYKKSGLGHEMEREWNNWRKVSEYYKYHAGLQLHLWDAFPVEVVKNGKKRKFWRARIELSLSFKVEADYQDKFGTSEFMKKLRTFMHEYIMKKEILSAHADPLYYTMLGLHNDVKQFLEMSDTQTVY